MPIIDLRNCIIPVILQNTNEAQSIGDQNFNTTDLIYVDSQDEIKDISEIERITSPTDYAIMNNAMTSDSINSSLGKKSGWVCLRSANDSDLVGIIDTEGDLSRFYVSTRETGVCPAMRLNLSSITSVMYRDFFKISEVETKNSSKYHTIEFGEYPKIYVGDIKNKELERLYSAGSLRLTGKTYTGRIDNDGSIISHSEFEHEGHKYVRVLTQKYDNDSVYSDGTTAPQTGTYLWAKVEPIVWKIRNWDELPKNINLNGSEKANFLDIKAEEAVVTLPFYPNCGDVNCSMWQNSTIRGYLNGINVNNIKTNGNPLYTADKGGDFSKQNFLTEAFMIDDLQQTHNNQQNGVWAEQNKISNANDLQSQNIQQENVVEETPRRKRLIKGYGVQVMDKPMSVNEQIKFYIEKGKSFMLHGPSGVGKSRRIEEIDPEFVSIVLRNGILPEEVIGKTIYFNNDKTTSGTWVPPAWYIDLCEKCKREPNKNHVLFIDEITNVKPSEQSLVFHLVLNNSIGPNIGKLPPNVVVAAAGNSKEESESAYNMPEPLFRRFDGHIELRPNIYSWLEWGSQQSSKGEDRLKIHPLISNFVGAYNKKVFYSPYDSEEPPKYAIDPRGWEQVSDIIYDNKGVIAKELIENKVGKEIATALLAFAQTPRLMIEDILDKNYSYEDIPTNFDAQYALALSLRSAQIDQIKEVREFIGKELSREILAMFDVLWVGEDNERAIHIANLPKLKFTQNSISSIPEREM